MILVDRGDGVVFKFSEEDAKRYLAANPGAKRIRARGARGRTAEETRAAEIAESKAVHQGEVEDKALSGPAASPGRRRE
jgi:hypothetical protein